MSTIDFRRALMSQWGVTGPKYDDLALGEIFCQADTVNGYPVFRKVAMTPYVDVTGGHSVTFYHGFPKTSTICVPVVGDNGGYIDYWPLSQAPSRTVTLTSNAKKVSMPFNFDALATVYIYDATDGVYLWRGSDYI